MYPETHDFSASSNSCSCSELPYNLGWRQRNQPVADFLMRFAKSGAIICMFLCRKSVIHFPQLTLSYHLSIFRWTTLRININYLFKVFLLKFPHQCIYCHRNANRIYSFKIIYIYINFGIIFCFYTRKNNNRKSTGLQRLYAKEICQNYLIIRKITLKILIHFSFFFSK